MKNLINPKRTVPTIISLILICFGTHAMVSAPQRSFDTGREMNNEY
jgi:hypothetical protein